MSADEKAVNAAKGDPEEKTPAQIRADIEETREELGDTVEALAEKTDVKAQAQAKVEDAKEQANAKVEEVKVQAQQNPKPLAIAGGALALLILWRLLRR